MSNNNNAQTRVLSAIYNSPTNQTFNYKTVLNPPLSVSEAPKDRATYLQALRTACAEMQEQVNKELTQRMEEDNTRAGADKSKIDDKKEEENYGEEVVDED